MDRTELLNSITEIFHDVLDDDDIVINEDTRLDSLEDWDSLAQLNFRNSISKEFNIKFKVNELVKMNNVKEILDIISERLQGTVKA